jgi:D-serine deaminase-like pyridoxal phosphate-dependent protein
VSSRRDFLRALAVIPAASALGCTKGGGVIGTDDAGCPTLPAPQAPPNLAYPGASYFAQIAADLDTANIGTPQVFIDMDRLDANIAEIAAKTGAGRWRIVEKSLPSLDLLEYVQKKSGSQKFLVLHLPFLPGVLSRFPNADVLVGKTHVKTAVRAFLQSQPQAATRVTFIADSAERLADLAQIGKDLGIVVRVAVEIDVGLRRSGVSDPSQLPAVLSGFLGNIYVQFAGFLGYDGHVPYAPGATLDAVQSAFTDATAAYQAFVNVLNNGQFQSLLAPGLVMNSGGSATYPMYTSGPVNDVAAGGGVLRPGDYPNWVIGALLPAIFIATPVFRVYPQPQLPFFTPESSATLFKGLQGVTIYGGGWPAYFTYPAGLQPAPLISDLTDYAMVPNQGMVTAPASASIAPGDWVFYHPRQSDALFQFETILEVRGGRLAQETMAAYPRRY